MKRAWLKDVEWNHLVEINKELCAPKHALHKGTSDGFVEAQKLWEQNYKKLMGLDDAVEFCRRCHRLGPFCNYNGNTFVAVIRTVINQISGLLPHEKALARSLAGHIVAGTAQPDEEVQFKTLLGRLGA